MGTHRSTPHRRVVQFHQCVLGIALAAWLSASALVLFPSSAAADGAVTRSPSPPQLSTPETGNESSLGASGLITYTYHFPVVRKAPPPAPVCQPLAEGTYGNVDADPPPTDRPAALHADLNLQLRGWTPTSAYLGLVDYGGGTDSNAPQLYSLFADNRTPIFAAAYRVYNWDWGCNCRTAPMTNYPVTFAGLATTPGEFIRAPTWPRDIGQTVVYEAMVLYASQTQLTLKYTRDDNVVRGYTIHLENVCVDANLLASYNYWNSVGRDRLPAIWAGQFVGRAFDNTIGVSIRDTGEFMDPRSRKDWWQGR